MIAVVADSILQADLWCPGERRCSDMSLDPKPYTPCSDMSDTFRRLPRRLAAAGSLSALSWGFATRSAPQPLCIW